MKRYDKHMIVHSVSSLDLQPFPSHYQFVFLLGFGCFFSDINQRREGFFFPLRPFPQSSPSSEMSKSLFPDAIARRASLRSHVFSSVSSEKSSSAHGGFTGISRQQVPQRRCPLPSLHADLDGRGHHDAASLVVLPVDPLVTAAGGRRAVGGHGGVVGVHDDASLCRRAAW